MLCLLTGIASFAAKPIAVAMAGSSLATCGRGLHSAMTESEVLACHQA